jgi:hypothetical protein
MSNGMNEQRNAYKGTTPHAWIRLRLVARNGTVADVELIVDTGNPLAVIIDSRTMAQFRHGDCASLTSNFGQLDGGWLRVVVPEAMLDQMMVGFSSDIVAGTARQDSPDFQGLIGLPLLRMMEYGGDPDWFWIRPAAGVP